MKKFFGRSAEAPAGRQRGVRIYLGTEPGHKARSLWAMTGEAVGILAPPSYGKTSGQMMGAVAGWSRAVVSSTTKSDVCLATYAGRAAIGPVFALNLDAARGGIGPVPPIRFRLLAGWQAYSVAVERAEAIVPGEAGRSRGTEGFFRAQAVKLLAAYGHAAALRGGGLDDVLDWSSARDTAKPTAIIERSSPARASVARSLARITGEYQGTVSGIFMELENVLAPLEDDNLRWAADAPEGYFDPAAFIRANGTLYLTDEKGGDQKRSPRVPLVLALVDQLIQGAKQITAPMGDRARHEPVLLLALDEVACCCPMPALAGVLSTLPGRGVYTSWASQSYALLEREWEAQGARAIDNATHNVILMGGLSGDADFVERYSSLLGEEEVEDVSESHPGRYGGQASGRTVRMARRRRIPASTLIAQPKAEGVLFREGGFEPVDLKPAAWNRDFRGLIADSHQLAAPPAQTAIGELTVARRGQDVLTPELAEFAAWVRNTYRPAQALKPCWPMHVGVVLQLEALLDWWGRVEHLRLTSDPQAGAIVGPQIVLWHDALYRCLPRMTQELTSCSQHRCVQHDQLTKERSAWEEAEREAAQLVNRAREVAIGADAWFDPSGTGGPEAIVAPPAPSWAGGDNAAPTPPGR